MGLIKVSLIDRIVEPFYELETGLWAIVTILASWQQTKSQPFLDFLHPGIKE